MAVSKSLISGEGLLLTAGQHILEQLLLCNWLQMTPPAIQQGLITRYEQDQTYLICHILLSADFKLNFPFIYWKLCGRSLTQSGQVLCEAMIPELASEVQVSATCTLQPTQLFAFHQSGTHVLIRCSGGSVVCQVCIRTRIFITLETSSSAI